MRLINYLLPLATLFTPLVGENTTEVGENTTKMKPIEKIVSNIFFDSKKSGSSFNYIDKPMPGDICFHEHLTGPNHFAIFAGQLLQTGSTENNAWTHSSVIVGETEDDELLIAEAPGLNKKTGINKLDLKTSNETILCLRPSLIETSDEKTEEFRKLVVDTAQRLSSASIPYIDLKKPIETLQGFKFNKDIEIIYDIYSSGKAKDNKLICSEFAAVSLKLAEFLFNQKTCPSRTQFSLIPHSPFKKNQNYEFDDVFIISPKTLFDHLSKTSQFAFQSLGNRTFMEKTILDLGKNSDFKPKTSENFKAFVENFFEISKNNPNVIIEAASVNLLNKEEADAKSFIIDVTLKTLHINPIKSISALYNLYIVNENGGEKNIQEREIPYYVLGIFSELLNDKLFEPNYQRDLDYFEEI